MKASEIQQGQFVICTIKLSKEEESIGWRGSVVKLIGENDLFSPGSSKVTVFLSLEPRKGFPKGLTLNFSKAGSILSEIEFEQLYPYEFINEDERDSDENQENNKQKELASNAIIDVESDNK